MKYEPDSNADRPSELKETAVDDFLELPVPTEPLHSWRGTASPDAVFEFCEQMLARFWSQPEWVRRRDAQRIAVPFEI